MTFVAEQPQLMPGFEEEPLELEAPVIAVAELPDDELARDRADLIIKRAGSLAVHEALPIIEHGSISRYKNLKEAALAAANGDAQAQKVILTNSLTDIVERTIKAGHIMEVNLAVDENCKIIQHGQAMEDVYENALRFASASWQMRERAEAETRNGSRIEHHYRHGRLEDYWFVVISRAADNMSERDMGRAGFFTDTMTTVIQATTASSNGLVTQSAFVAGVKLPNEQRHDKRTVSAMGCKLNIDFSGLSAAETIDTPFLVHKSLMPNGVVDMARLYDECVDDGNTFFGETKPKQDYLQYREACARREAELIPVAHKVTGHIIAEAPTFTTELDATERLNELSQQYMVDRAMTDVTINPQVFGSAAAASIEQARIYAEQGRGDLADKEMIKAQKTATSSSCPAAIQAKESQSASELKDNSKKSDKEEKKIKAMRCPHCDARVVADPCAKILSCWDCKALVVNGQVRSEGDGGSKAKEEKNRQDEKALAGQQKAEPDAVDLETKAKPEAVATSPQPALSVQ